VENQKETAQKRGVYRTNAGNCKAMSVVIDRQDHGNLITMPVVVMQGLSKSCQFAGCWAFCLPESEDKFILIMVISFQRSRGRVD
jgi:hypothetical protein